MADYWFTLDESVVAANDHDISMTFSSGWSPVDVTAWANLTYKAESDTLTGTITVANAAMVKSDSGSGTTDTVTIPAPTPNSPLGGTPRSSLPRFRPRTGRSSGARSGLWPRLRRCRSGIRDQH